VRQDISPPKKSIAENIDDEVEDCIMNMVWGFGTLGLIEIEEFGHMIILAMKEEIERMNFVMVWTYFEWEKK
jgi:hypothetical protein